MLSLFVVVAVSIGIVAGIPLPQLSFGDKYEKIDSSGNRIIGDGFMYGGTTEVKKSFIRLTPDRQSKRGHIWSLETINNDQIVAILTYRIHGQGRKWFGDGIGVWFTHEKVYANGDNHGFIDKYYGVGIILDTFKNIEHRGGHKDVTVQINDGTKTLDVLNDEEKLGCDAAFRYHGGSAAFDPVYSSSRIRVKIEKKKLEIDVDPRSEGVWSPCYKGDLPFSEEWLKRASVGLSASTGSLADNHDIIKLATFNDTNDYGVATADAEVWSHNYSKDYDKIMASEFCDQSCKITMLTKFIDNFHKETEHWFEELKESTQNTVAKLKEREKQNQKRIQVLTDRMHDVLDVKVGQRVADVKSHVANTIADKVEDELKVAGSSWRFPFFILVVALATAFGFAYQKYQKLVKNHLL